MLTEPKHIIENKSNYVNQKDNNFILKPLLMWLWLYEETDAENVKTDMEIFIFGFKLFF